MKKNAFTLVELLGVISIIVIISMIAIPNITNSIKRAENKLTDAQKEIVFSAVDLYLEYNPNDYELNNGDTYSIPIVDLVNEDLLEESFVKNTDGLDDTMCVSVTVVDSNKNTTKNIGDC